ncbi:hypothetical protein HZA99_06130 [Candidatus Woesearchaeota archaeon]|nr:hypothetical protein [Candidatus Woesearchaeota archaeon]
MRKQMQKTIAEIVAASLLANACAVRHELEWKTVEVVSTRYDKIEERKGSETERQAQYVHESPCTE